MSAPGCPGGPAGPPHHERGKPVWWPGAPTGGGGVGQKIEDEHEDEHEDEQEREED